MNEILFSFLGKKEICIFDTFAQSTNGSVYYQQGNNVLLATVVVNANEIVKEDFLPLTVQYIERSYAAGKFPGGYIKRESKPSDFETLSARVVDRSLRPLFPKDYCYPTQITILVLSADLDADLQVLALNAASAVLFISEIPINIPVSAVRIGKINGEFVINPEKLTQSTLDLLVSGTNEDLLMIEMRSLQESKAFNANEVEEEELLEALSIAQEAIVKRNKLIIENLSFHIKSPILFFDNQEDCSSQILDTYIKEYHFQPLKDIIYSLSKTERQSELLMFAQQIMQKWKEKNPEDLQFLEERVLKSISKLKREIVRDLILKEGRRVDGRGLKEVRPIDIKTNILPKAHASVLFTRGQTQALVVATIGCEADAQSYELLTDKASSKERFMVHYNFPPFCVGEANSVSAPTRRELGHGNLAKRALEPTLIENKHRTIRLVSEILESNGSSSMATVCGGSLALTAADIECTDLVAGVAMGLVYEGEKYAILTDIVGLEDHDGDMDFKIAGSKKGITAIQMDIKLMGLKLDVLRDILYQAKEARIHILEIMEKAKESIIINKEVLPSFQTFLIHPSRIVDIIGPSGKTIKEIIE
ncbi:MAG: polyribonucleotide nucleotidyltransferase [Helicobacter sp.]|nr:polyribonucleotide nucleotidyltransferase [Helicobacter sp.]